MNIFSIMKLAVVIVAAIIFISSTLTLMTSSYAEWVDYYNAAMAEKENQKYLESLPLTFEGVSVSLKDGVVYYANGKAAVKKDDLNVVAHFSEKGKYTDKILSSDEFEIETPESFSAAGGTVIVKYLYQPEKAEGATEEPAPILRTTELKLELVPISITSLNIITNPYRVYYKESMTFDISGIEIEAVLNCGDTVNLDEKNITVLTDGKLAAGTESIKIAFTNDGVTVEAESPVTVKSAAEYDESEIVDIKVEGDIYMLEGQKLADAKPIVRATYKNGNRLVLASDAYTVTGNVEAATILSTCSVNVALKNNAGVSCTAPVTVRYNAEAENAALVGGVQNTVTVDGQAVTVIEGFANGDKITFGITSTTVAKVGLSLRLANNSTKSVRPSDVMSLKINGRCYLVPANVILPPKNTIQGYGFVDFLLPAVLLNEGENVIEITFGAMNNIDLAIDLLNVETTQGSTVTFGEYLVNAKDKGATVTATAIPTTGKDGKINVNVDKIKNQLYSMGGVSDGQYIYVSMNAKNNVETVISKIDPTTNTVVAQTTSFKPGAEKIDNSRIFIYGDVLYCIIQDGSMVEIDLNTFNGFGCAVKKSTISFASLGTAFDATWNESAGRIAVITKEKQLYILDESLSVVAGNISVVNGTAGANSVTSDDKFIYVSYMDGLNTIIDVFTWDGEIVDRVNVGGFALGTETKFNVQAIFVHDGQIHVAVCSWGTTYKEAFFDWTVTIK